MPSVIVALLTSACMSQTKFVVTVTNPQPRSHSRRASSSSLPSVLGVVDVVACSCSTSCRCSPAGRAARCRSGRRVLLFSFDRSNASATPLEDHARTPCCRVASTPPAVRVERRLQRRRRLLQQRAAIVEAVAAAGAASCPSAACRRRRASNGVVAAPNGPVASKRPKPNCAGCVRRIDGAREQRRRWSACRSPGGWRRRRGRRRSRGWRRSVAADDGLDVVVAVAGDEGADDAEPVGQLRELRER